MEAKIEYRILNVEGKKSGADRAARASAARNLSLAGLLPVSVVGCFISLLHSCGLQGLE